MAAQPQVTEQAPKTYYRIGEVSRLTGTKAFVLRYWETEFPTLRPVKTPSGHRLYSRKDIETIFQIKRLLYDEGFTIAGARRYLAEQNGGQGVEELVQAEASAVLNRQVLVELREELRAMLNLLKRG